MPRTIDVNRIYTNEELDAMLNIVNEEITLASDLVQSYQRDLSELEANTTMSEEQKSQRRAFLQNAIRESEDLRNMRTKQFGAIQVEKIDREVSNKIIQNQEMNRIWNDTTLRSRGMDTIMREAEEERNTAMNNAASVLASAARKLAEEIQAEQITAQPNQGAELNSTTNIPRPTYMKESDKWEVVDTSKAPIIKFKDENGIIYNYEPNTENITKTETIGKHVLEAYWDMKTNSWNQIPDEVRDSNKFYNQLTGKWQDWKIVKAQMDEEKSKYENAQENGDWSVPLIDKNGNYILDENGRVMLKNMTGPEFLATLGTPIPEKSEAEKAALAEKIHSKIESETTEINDSNIDQVAMGEWAKTSQKDDYGEFGPSKADSVIQKAILTPKLNIFQKIKLWFMRLFNKNYILSEMVDNTFYMNASPEILKQKEEALKESERIQELQKEDKKHKREELIESIKHPIKTIRNIRNKPSTKKQKLKDPKKTLLKAGAVGLALTIAGAGGVAIYNAYTKAQLEKQAQEEAQKQAELEAQREAEEQQALQEALAQQQEAEEQDDDVLVQHSGNELTTGSEDRQYLAPSGLEYTENSLGQGKRGTLSQDTVVNVYNRAIVNDDEILLTSNEQTWEDYAQSQGMSMEELEKILNEDGNREMVAIQVADTNHNIFNVYGWVDATELEENKEGKIELVQGDNTEMLEQLQNQEQEGER